VLLIHGAGNSMLSWEDEFCGRLAAGDRLIARYDNRDCGRSVSYPTGAPHMISATSLRMPWVCWIRSS
jgi:pimeloyl-ACP methyl ester carboxylesterase